MKVFHLSALCLAAVAMTGCAQQGPTAAATPPAPPAVAAVTTGQELGSALDNKIQVNFAPGSERLAAGADKQLDVAARLFRDVRPIKMFSTGYSDAVGDQFSNLILAAKRARTVKAALVSRGIPPDQIMLRSYGESDPINKADPDSGENRRVVVTWEIM